jgi:guanylate kinase
MTHISIAVSSIILASSMFSTTMAFSPSLRHASLRPSSNWALNVLSSPLSPRKRALSIEKEMFTGKTAGQTLVPLVVCGPSGVGKGTIIEKYMKEYNGSERFGFTVSHTTRKPRPGEVDGVHYHFTDVPTIESAIQSNKFLEFAEVHGNWYGTSIASLSFVQDQEEKLPMLDIDVQGVKNIKEWQKNQDNGENGPELGLPKLEAKFIFIAPPSLETLKRRLNARGTETPESLEKRTNNAIAELEYGSEEGNFDATIVNDDLDQACADFDRAINELYGNEI